jgi:choline monooxygenase
MNDRSPTARLASSQAQLPVSAYFEEDVFKQEMESIFRRSALYVGSEKAVPNVGDWQRLAHEGGGRVLVRNATGVELISNVCRHRQALILGGEIGNVAGATNGSGNLGASGGHIVCPLHRWTYDTRGELLGAPQFETRPCRHLDRFELRHCHGLLYEGLRDPAHDMAPLFARPEFDFSDYELDHVEVHTCHYNWKTFIEVYLEDYHVGPFHPGLGNFVTCEDLSWAFADTYSLQRVGVNNALAQPGSDVYGRWHERLLDYRDGAAPEFGAIWVTYFPTHMIELYPHALVVSTLYPKSPQETINVVEFYYPSDIAAFEREFVDAHRAAYLETVIEDDEIGERMDAGRFALHRRGGSDAGPYQSPMEDGMRHFHEWYRKTMRLPTAAASTEAADACTACVIERLRR